MFNFNIKKEATNKKDSIFEVEIDGKIMDITEKFIQDDLDNAILLIEKNKEELDELVARKEKCEQLLKDIKKINK